MPLLRCWSWQQRQEHGPKTSLTKSCTILVVCYWLSVAQGFTAVTSTAVATSSNSLSWALRSSSRSRAASPLTAQRRTAASSAAASLVMSEARAEPRRTLVVIGGGAAGYFGAIQAASCSSSSELRVVVLEAGKLPLQKVKISGGGRCNVMHDTSKAVSLIAKGYPRGSKQLIGPFKSLFGPAEAAGWFGARGVSLKTEGDGRMFPVTDDSQTIINCLEGAARKADVQVVTSARVMSIAHRAHHNGDDDDDYNSSNNKDKEVQQQQQQQQEQHFDVSFTTATPLSQAVRSALGATVVTAGSAGVGGVVASDPNHSKAVDGAATGAAGMTDGGARMGDTGSRKSERSSYRISCDYVLQATGAAREGHGWAKRLGHAVSAPVPSLFTLTVRDPRLEGLAGLSVQDAELKLFAENPKPKGEEGSSVRNGKSHADGSVGVGTTTDQARGGKEELGADNTESGETKKKTRNKNKAGKKKLAIVQRGPLLITHSGVSGPAALKLSAFGARVLNEGGYRGKLVVNWLAGNNPSRALEDLQAFRTKNPKKTVYAFCPIGGAIAAGTSDRSTGSRPSSSSPPPSSALPRRLWQSLALAVGVEAGDKWAELSKAKLSALAQQLTACDLQIVGKGSFKEEFVTCGGVELSNLDMRTMESRRVPGLFFAGEVVDIDGVTGGFNFQSAWTTGWVAGTAVGARAAGAGLGAAGEVAAAGTRPGVGAAGMAAAGAGVVAAEFELRGSPHSSNREVEDREGPLGGAGPGRRKKNGRRRTAGVTSRRKRAFGRRVSLPRKKTPVGWVI